MKRSTWDIDTSHSGINFNVRHMVFAKVRGRFSRWRGTIELDESALVESEVHVAIEAASIDTNEAQRDQHLRSPDFFDVEHYPELTFHSRRIERAGGNSLRIIGDLTMRGITREIVLEAETLGAGKDPSGGERRGFGAKTIINRQEYGLKWNQLLEAGGVVVGDQVHIEIEIEAVRRIAQASSA